MKAIVVFAACLVLVYGLPLPTMKRDDFHDEFDYLLMIRIKEEIHRGEHELLHLQMKIDKFEKDKQQEERDEIIREMEIAIARASGIENLLKNELKRKDLNIFEQYNFEMALKSSQILVRDLKKEEERIKKIQI